MNTEDREKLLDVAGFLQGWLAFKKPVPPDEIVRLHFDLVMEVLSKNNEALDLVSNPLPTKEEVIAEGDKQIKDWLMGNSFEERTAYRIGFRRSFEYVLRFIK